MHTHTPQHSSRAIDIMESEASNTSAEFGAKAVHYLKVVLVVIADVGLLVWLFFLSVPLILYYSTGLIIEAELIVTNSDAFLSAD